MWITRTVVSAFYLEPQFMYISLMIADNRITIRIKYTNIILSGILCHEFIKLQTLPKMACAHMPSSYPAAARRMQSAFSYSGKQQFFHRIHSKYGNF